MNAHHVDVEGVLKAFMIVTAVLIVGSRIKMKDEESSSELGTAGDGTDTSLDLR